MENEMIDTVEKYLTYINSLNDKFNSKKNQCFIFRGESDEEYVLLPSLFRKDSLSNNNKYSKENNKHILENFIQQAMGYKPDIPFSAYSQWSEYAQHYGAPTCLLDWTSNPLIALFFSCKDNKEKNGCVSILNYDNYNIFINKENAEEGDENITTHERITNNINGKKEYKFPIVYLPNYIDVRMSAQDSWLMAWGSDDSSLEKILKNVKIACGTQYKQTKDVVGSRTTNEDVLLQLKIDKSKKQSIIRELDMLGINEKTLFPGLDGLGRYIERKYRFDYQEEIDNF